MFSYRAEEDQLYDFDASLGATNSSGPISTSYGKQRPLISSVGRAAIGSRSGITTAHGGGEARPMTSVSGAGFKSNKESKSFDPLNLGKGPAPPLAEKVDNGPEDKARDMERSVHRLLEASADAVLVKDTQRALDKAKEAIKADRSLCKYRETHNLAEQINSDLSYSVLFSLANAFHHNGMYEEAIQTYQTIVKNKQFPQSGRLRVNMGNIYYEQRKYTQAVKMYRMALDQLPSTNKELRFQILRNIGNSFVKLGQFQDAIDSYESVMAGAPDIQSGFNLMVCLFARGDKEKMRRHFTKLLTIPIVGMTEQDEEELDSTDLEQSLDSGRVDAYREDLTARRESFRERILTAARLIAPVIDEEDDWAEGYKWVLEQLKHSFETVASKLEIDLAMMLMKSRRFEDAIDVLKSFEKKDASLRAIAATNLSFIYFLEGDLNQAEKQADLAIKNDRYNAKALVNKGNCFYTAGEFAKAKDLYLEAVGVEADCVEAIYNLGLVNLKVNSLQEAHQAFDKLYSVLPSVPEALFHIANIYERAGSQTDLNQAAKTFEMLLSKVPGDPNICVRLGQIYEKLEDETTSHHWYTEAHRHHPVNLNVISWLGVWYVKRELYEQAIEYFERAAVVQPSEVKWRLMVTSCYRRLGDLSKAFELYQRIHEDHPENIEALQYLEALCKDQGRNHEEYSKKLEKLRRSQPMVTQGNTMTRAAIGAQGAAVPQRSERPQRQSEVSRNLAKVDEIDERYAIFRNLKLL